MLAVGAQLAAAGSAARENRGGRHEGGEAGILGDGSVGIRVGAAGLVFFGLREVARDAFRYLTAPDHARIRSRHNRNMRRLGSVSPISHTTGGGENGSLRTVLTCGTDNQKIAILALYSRADTGIRSGCGIVLVGVGDA